MNILLLSLKEVYSYERPCLCIPVITDLPNLSDQHFIAIIAQISRLIRTTTENYVSADKVI